MGKYLVKVKDARNKFSSTHFLLDHDKCSRLHGHNYTVGLSIQGDLDDHYFVVDFILIKKKLQEIVNALDHLVLIPTECEYIKINVDRGQVEVQTPSKRYSFPQSDVCFLPLKATTSELLAKYIHERFKEVFQKYKLKVTVGESTSTKAVYKD